MLKIFLKIYFCFLFILLISPAELFARNAIRIGVTLGITGKYAPIGRMKRKAFLLWAEKTNSQGGILGRKVKIFVYDDQSDPKLAKKIYRRMILDEQMDLLFPPYSSGLTSAILPITEKYGYPMLLHGAAADSIFRQGYRYVFGIFPPATIYTLGFMELCLYNRIGNVAIFSSDDPFGMNIAKGAEKWAKRLGIKVVSRRTFKKGTRNLRFLALECRKKKAQAVVMCGHFDESVDMRKAFSSIGWYPIAYWASAGPVLNKYKDVLGRSSELTFSSTQWAYYDKLPFPGSREFYRSFKKKYGITPSYHAATAYTAGDILTAAIRKAGKVDRERIRRILRVTDRMTILGRFGVDRTGLQIRYFHLIIQWINGRKEVVWPIELSTKKARFK